MTDDLGQALQPLAERGVQLGCARRKRRGLIGREHPTTVLCEAIDHTVNSHGGLVLVTGEAGIGKTTLVTGVLEEARQEGVLVLIRQDPGSRTRGRTRARATRNTERRAAYVRAIRRRW